ncbi:MAG: diphosphomevalonate decarboxylase [Candidatus Woesearchaeota archaeon]
MKSTAIAHPNIALVKYWGKRNEQLKLPTVSSLSLTLDNFYSKTTVEFSKDLTEDTLVINGKAVTGGRVLERVKEHLDLIRKTASEKSKRTILAKVMRKKPNENIVKDMFAKIVSENNFPAASGIASSSSAFTALTLAASKAVGLEMDKKDISIIARQGSGSACRSIFGGIVEWKKGKKDDGSDCFAEQIHDSNFWPELKMIVFILDAREKKIKSSDGMKISVKTSPFYDEWTKASEKDLKEIKQSIAQKDFTKVGTIMETNCLRMHSLMISSTPSLIYWKPETLIMIEKINSLRENGIECYFTIDAGANIMMLCLEKDVERILGSIEGMPCIHDFMICSLGEGAKHTDDHMF